MVHGDLGPGPHRTGEQPNEPKPAAKEENIAEAIEVWEEKCKRLARPCKMYNLAEAFRVEALKKILIGKTKEYYELWQAEKMQFETLLKKVKEHARGNKLDTDVAKGRAGVALGTAQQDQSDCGAPHWGQEEHPGVWEQGANAIAQGKKGEGEDTGEGKWG